MCRSKKILFLTPYPKDTAGSQRFRFEQYLELLNDSGFEYDIQSFIDEPTWFILYKKGYLFQKVCGIFSGFIRRIWVLFKVHKFDFIFVHREAAPIGFPITEWLVANIWQKKVIYDFDDAIWIPNTSSENRLISWFKFPQKVNRIIKWSHMISAGNQFLADYSLQFNPSVCINPTTIDTVGRHIPKHNKGGVPVIGWTGTHSTLKYLEALRQPLQQLAKECDFEFLVIADKIPQIPFPNQRFASWNKQTEIEDLNQIDIGVMPLENDQWAEGKCGFKALQFMALEKPVLVSPVGVNSNIVTSGVNGFHCSDREEWLERMKLLLKDRSLRSELGKEGRKHVIEKFSVTSNAKNFLSLFD